MKNLVIFLCILCSSLLFINPIQNMSHANDNNKIHQQIELTVEQAKELLLINFIIIFYKKFCRTS